MRPLLKALAVSLVATTAYAQQPTSPTPLGKLVDVGGRKMHLYCIGRGSPTVVLESGASAFAIDWQRVQPLLSNNNRVCSYDRLGYGWSDSIADSDANTVSNLHALLQNAGEQPPFVMVGASRGGLFVRLYQAQYPSEVVGLVLVDPTHEERLYTMYQGKALSIATLTAEQLRTTVPSGKGFVKIPQRTPQEGRPFDQLPRELYETRVALDAKLIRTTPDSLSYESVLENAETDRAILAQLRDQRRKHKRPLGNLPLVILTRGADTDNDRIMAYDEMSQMSSNSRHTVVIGSGHEIHLFKPEAVIEAISDVIAAARDNARLKAR